MKGDLRAAMTICTCNLHKIAIIFPVSTIITCIFIKHATFTLTIFTVNKNFEVMAES